MNLADLLNEALTIKGVTSAAVVAQDGKLVEGASNSGQDLSFIGGLITSGMASSRVLAELLGEGEITQTMIEFDGGPVLITPLRGATSEGYVAVMTLGSASDMGRARFGLRKLLPQLADAVAA